MPLIKLFKLVVALAQQSNNVQVHNNSRLRVCNESNWHGIESANLGSTPRYADSKPYHHISLHIYGCKCAKKLGATGLNLRIVVWILNTQMQTLFRAPYSSCKTAKKPRIDSQQKQLNISKKIKFIRLRSKIQAFFRLDVSMSFLYTCRPPLLKNVEVDKEQLY